MLVAATQRGRRGHVSRPLSSVWGHPAQKDPDRPHQYLLAHRRTWIRGRRAASSQCVTESRPGGLTQANDEGSASVTPRRLQCARIWRCACMGAALQPGGGGCVNACLDSSVMDEADPLAAALQENENLKAALLTRHRIGIAQGLVMARYGIDEGHAFRYLARRSQHANIKLRVLVDEVIAELTEDGKSRPPSGGPD